MAEKPDRSMVRKALWDLICQTAERLQQESRQPLSKAEALVATAHKYPTLYMSYTDAVTRGDPPSELYTAPVAKRALSEREQVFEGIMNKASVLAVTKGITREQALVDLTHADPSLYQQYLDAKP